MEPWFTGPGMTIRPGLGQIGIARQKPGTSAGMIGGRRGGAGGLDAGLAGIGDSAGAATHFGGRIAGFMAATADDSTDSDMRVGPTPRVISTVAEHAAWQEGMAVWDSRRLTEASGALTIRARAPLLATGARERKAALMRERPGSHPVLPDTRSHLRVSEVSRGVFEARLAVRVPWFSRHPGINHFTDPLVLAEAALRPAVIVAGVSWAEATAFSGGVVGVPTVAGVVFMVAGAVFMEAEGVVMAVVAEAGADTDSTLREFNASG